MSTIDRQKVEEKAVGLFYSGYNCAQSVLLSFSDFIKMDGPTATKLASGFGAGMGRLQNTCGAVTGAYMVLGLHSAKPYPLIQQFEQQFSQINGSTECRSLINCDLRSEDGQEEFRLRNLKQAVCEKCIKDAIRLVDEVLR